MNEHEQLTDVLDSLSPNYPFATDKDLAAPERVKCATLHIGDTLYWGVTHGDITINKLTDAELESIEHMSDEQINTARGFLTTHDRPVTIAEGYDIAEKSGQLDESADRGHPQSEHVHTTLEEYRKAA